MATNHAKKPSTKGVLNLSVKIDGRTLRGHPDDIAVEARQLGLSGSPDIGKQSRLIKRSLGRKRNRSKDKSIRFSLFATLRLLRAIAKAA